MAADKFFKPENEPPAPPAQDELLSPEQLAQLLDYVPSWHACALGPVPFGNTERARITVNYIICPDRESAEDALNEHIHDACEHWDHPYDEDEWDVLHVVPVNCS